MVVDHQRIGRRIMGHLCNKYVAKEAAQQAMAAVAAEALT
jgi:hypothetical protein